MGGASRPPSRQPPATPPCHRAISMLSQCYLNAFSMLSLCYLYAISMLSLCYLVECILSAYGVHMGCISAKCRRRPNSSWLRSGLKSSENSTGAGCPERLEFDNILITGLPPRSVPWVHPVGRRFPATLPPASCHPPCHRAISMLSQCYLNAISMLSLCYLYAISMLSLCYLVGCILSAYWVHIGCILGAYPPGAAGGPIPAGSDRALKAPRTPREQDVRRDSSLITY